MDLGENREREREREEEREKKEKINIYHDRTPKFRRT